VVDEGSRARRGEPPCQCTAVGSGSSFFTVMLTGSPRFNTIVGPGTYGGGGAWFDESV
jgi:hypothetical protein